MELNFSEFAEPQKLSMKLVRYGYVMDTHSHEFGYPGRWNSIPNERTPLFELVLSPFSDPVLTACLLV